MYDDVIAAPPSSGGDDNSQPPHTPGPPIANSDGHSPNNANPPYHQMGNNIQPNQVGRRHQLYIGNLTWVRLNLKCSVLLFLVINLFYIFLQQTYGVLFVVSNIEMLLVRCVFFSFNLLCFYYQ